ncbi:hypothetical protein HMPREF6123_1279 [Oribacterium sinus F0268]|uniref:Uncharacterized protein n=1 Tax=Oribacterium sinus F0268 TaxID=585501 RepID=C2KXR0_9FIRM|nr:hypothetical protein HMPREF6123_1279 [Oribacterium sinus F0268]
MFFLSFDFSIIEKLYSFLSGYPYKRFYYFVYIIARTSFPIFLIFPKKLAKNQKEAKTEKEKYATMGWKFEKFQSKKEE